MLWVPMVTILMWSSPVIAPKPVRVPQDRGTHSFQINPKPCSVNGLEGTCMFVYECIKTDGHHIGMCVDAFMFGSCCAHNLTDGELTRLPSNTEPAILFSQPKPNRPTRPSHPSQSRPVEQAHRPHFMTSSSSTPSPYKPSSSHRPSSTEKLQTFHSSTSHSNTRPFSSHASSSTERWTYHLSGNHNHVDVNQLEAQEGAGSNLVDATWSSSSHNWPTFVTRPRPSKPRPHLVSTTTTTSSTTTTSTTTTTTTPSTTTTTTTTLATTQQPHSVSANQKSSECGVSTLTSRHDVRIVGGRNSQFGVWPWQVSVRRTSFFGFSSTHRCGGALLNENWIATAGHCVDDLLASQIRIRVGEYDFSSLAEPYPFAERGVAKKVVHPKYNFFTYEYDLALVRLDNPLEFAPHIAPICLPASDDLLIGENATVTGWGRLSEGGTLPSVLQEVTVPIVSNDKCKSMFLRAGRHEFIPEIFMCAGFDDGGRDSCQGDSGGPLQVKGKDGRYFLAGIISWGIGCAEANLPGVCTRISKFVPWILQTVT